jgi:hypothetical protein
MTLLFAPADLITCRGCRCDDDHACVMPDGSPCSWVLFDIEPPTGVCSACAERVGWNPRALATMGVAIGPTDLDS